MRESLRSNALDLGKPGRDEIYGFGLVPNHAPAAELAATQVAHLKRWETPIKSSGFKAE